MDFIHEHPVRIISRVSKFAILLIVPLIRALFFSGGSLQKWITGAWIDILVLFFIFLLGFLVWFFDIYNICDDGIYKYSGIFKIDKTFYPIKNVSQITFEIPWYLKMFGAARLRIDTPAGNPRKTDIGFVVGIKRANSFYNDLGENYKNNVTIKGGFFPILGLMLLSSNGLTGVIYLFALISQSGNILGAEFEQKIVSGVTTTAQILAFGLPPLALTVSLLIIIGWFISFLLNIIRYANFLIYRKNNAIYISCGLSIDKHHFFMKFKNINFVQIKQTIFTKVLSLNSVFLGVVGYGKGKNEKNVLIPTFKTSNSINSINKLLPEYQFVEPEFRPPIKFFFRFLAIPIYIFLGIMTVVFILYNLFPNFSSLILFSGSMLWIADAFLFLIRIVSFYETGVSVKNNLITICYSKRFGFHKVCFNKEKLVKFTLRQTPFQKKVGCASLIFYIYGEKATKHIVPNLKYNDAKSILTNL